MDSPGRRLAKGFGALGFACALGAALGLVAGCGLALLPLYGAAGTTMPASYVLFGPFTSFATVVGAVCGLVLSPLHLFDRRPARLERALRSGALAAPVAFLAGALALGAAPFAMLAVFGSYLPAARPRGRGFARAAILPGICLAGVFGVRLERRLPTEEAELVPLLAANDMEVRGAATSALLRTSGAAGLARALADPDPAVREQAALATQRRPLAEVEGLLLGVVDDPNERVRNAAAGALFHFGVEEPLARALRDPSASTRSMMCRRVSYCGDASHVALLEPLLDDPDEGVRACAETTIAHLRGKVAPQGH